MSASFALTARAREEIEIEIHCGKDQEAVCKRFSISERQYYKMKRNLRAFGTVHPDPKQYSRQGRPPALTVEMEAAVVEFLIENKQAYLDEVADFLDEEFSVFPDKSTISRLLKRLKITAKKVSREAQSRDPDLRMFHLGFVARFPYNYFVFVDESAANERTADRKRGWSPKGTPCRVKSDTRKSKRWSILPAITADDGYITCEIYHGSFNGDRFADFISNQVLPQMSAFPAPRSILIIDNCSTHRTVYLRELCQ